MLLDGCGTPATEWALTPATLHYRTCLLRDSIPPAGWVLWEENIVSTDTLGAVYQDGQVIVREGETGDCMYVIQEGQVEVVVKLDGEEARVRTLGKNDFFGEMAIFEHEVRTATVRALGEARVLTIDKRNFLRGIHEDPSLAFRIIEMMSHRIRDLTERLVR
jgi:CRP/FNR family cyclic AMP-dependent transcriptional regulator